MNNLGFLQASKLKNNPSKIAAITKEVLQILRQIDEDIKKTCKEDKTYIIFSLPITFDICNMRNQDAQRQVWSRVIESLESRDFVIQHKLSESESLLKISWISEEEAIERSVQNNILAKYKVNNFKF